MYGRRPSNVKFKARKQLAKITIFVALNTMLVLLEFTTQMRIPPSIVLFVFNNPVELFSNTEPFFGDVLAFVLMIGACVEVVRILEKRKK